MLMADVPSKRTALTSTFPINKEKSNGNKFTVRIYLWFRLVYNNNKSFIGSLGRLRLE